MQGSTLIWSMYQIGHCRIQLAASDSASIAEALLVNLVPPLTTSLVSFFKGVTGMQVLLTHPS